jgi:hypothetical protein
MRAQVIETLLSLALRLARHADVRACLGMTLADVEDWHSGAIPPTADAPWYGATCDLDLRAVCPGCAQGVPFAAVGNGALFCEHCTLVSLVP